MSALDPLAAIVAGNADLTALIDAELASLAADAQALRALLVEGAVVTARVLPSNGLTDLLEIAGRRVAASLPPTVRPGDALPVRVTGFNGDRILLQIVATGADAAVETGPTSLPAAPEPSVFVSAPAAAPQTVLSNVPPPAASPARTLLGADFTSAVSRASVAPAQAGETNAAPQAAAVTMRGSVIAAGEPTSIEARVAAARATLAPAIEFESPGVALSPSARSSSAAVSDAVSATQKFVAPPHISQKNVVLNADAAPRRVPAGAYATPSAAPRASGLSAYTEPVALLRALRLPVTPSNVASAALAVEHPERLPAALAALERALPRGGADPNVATLRTLLGFVGRIDPRSPALATQIAAYVDHVVDGAEPKLATMLAATQAAAPSAPPTGARAGTPSDPPLPIATAVAAERATALNADLKQTLLAVAANPATPESLAPSLAGALTALTAVQMNAAQTLAANPDGLAFTIPLFTQHGTSNAHISVKRDAPQPRGGRVDAENFRIAFVLDTAHFGTVAIDLVTVGREVTVDVRTEAAPAMRAFRDALGTLTARLESLRYRVASAGASVGTTSTIAVEAPPSRPIDPNATMDRSA